MPHRFTRIGFLGFGVALAAGLFVVGCANQETTLGADADAGADGAVSGMDGSASDGGPSAPPSGPDTLWLGTARGAESNNDSFEGAAGTCFDGLDNDSESNDNADGVDCNDVGCQSLPSCCANDAACASLESRVVVDQDFEGCSDAICGEDFSIFGDPSPVVDAGSLALQGDTFYDSGLYGLEALNLRHERINLEVEFGLGECGEDCMETAAVALTAQEGLTDNDFVRPIVGLRALAPRGEVQLIIHDRVVATYPAEDGLVWQLSVRPDGTVVLTRNGVEVREEYVPVAGARIVLYGHSTNPGVDRVGARIESVKVERFVTDRVDAWSPARSLGLPGGRVSVARLDGVDYLAINDENNDETGDAVRFHLASDGSVLNWRIDSDWNARDYSVAQLDGVIYVYAINAAGNLVRGAVDRDLSQIGEPSLVCTPGEVGWGSMRNPAVVQVGDNTILVAEVGGALDAAFLEPTNEQWVALGTLPALTQGAREPSLVAHQDVYWLHYSVQNGTRQRVRAMVSDQMVYWRALGDALVGSGEPESVDRFSVASPALVSDGDSLRMYMSADDHVVRRVAVVERLSPGGLTR